MIEWVRTGENDPRAKELEEKVRGLIEKFENDPTVRDQLSESVLNLETSVNDRTKYTDEVLEKVLKTVADGRRVLLRAAGYTHY